MPQSKHLNYYGVLGLFVCLATTASFFILRNADCGIGAGENYDKLQPIQIAGMITGGILFILAFFNIANILYDIKIVFFLVVIAILGVAGVLFWGAYIAFSQPCTSFAGLNTSVLSKNAFDAEDTNHIIVMFLDILGGLMLCSMGFTFAKRL